MANYLRPCVALGPGWQEDGYYGPQSFQGWGTPTFMAQSRTPWVRLWISWPYLQPASWVTNPATATTVLIRPGSSTTVAQLWQQLLWQIQAARNQGCRVILTLYKTPSWANAWTRTLGPSTKENGAPRNIEFAPPDDAASPNGRFAYIVWYLAASLNMNNPYAAATNTWVDFLEVVNEPNYQMWPQYATGDRDTPLMANWAAAMMQTARYITKTYTGNQPLILGPGVADEPGSGSGNKDSWPMAPFIDRMLYIMRHDGLTQEDPYVAFSYHNYHTIWHAEDPPGDTDGTRSGSYIARSRLQGHWQGWPYGDVNNPQILATEGGGKMDISTINQDEVTQQRLMHHCWNRVYDPSNPEGPGAVMMTNYLMWSDLAYDTGLLKPFAIPPPNPFYRKVFGPPYGDSSSGWTNYPTTYPR